MYSDIIKLFRDFLKIRFESELSERDRHAWLTKAARLLESEGDWEQALNLHFRAFNYREAADIIIEKGFDLLKVGADWRLVSLGFRLCRKKCAGKIHGCDCIIACPNIG